ncbi:MAG: hypothetical protein ACLSFR_03720 [Alphaproteobacteria bacterium]
MENGFFWLVAAVAYVFWSYFFRFYFNRRPYLEWQPIVSSMIPSTKIVVLSVLFVTILIVLPFAPLFMGFSGEFFDRYSVFLQRYMQESDMVDLGLSLILMLASPVIIYRPFLAWISALIGRSGSLRSAWNRTRYNYWEFLLVALIFNFGFVAVQQFSSLVKAPLPVMLAVLSPIVVYFNVVMAKSYEFFFMDLDK